jgi:hypothetical protein
VSRSAPVVATILLLGVVTSCRGPVETRLDCGEERLDDLEGPFNTEARDCFVGAINAGQEAELRLFGFDEEGGRMDRILRTHSDRVEEKVASDTGSRLYTCDHFVVVDGPADNPGFNAVGCD